MNIPAGYGRAALSPCARRTFSSFAARPAAAIPSFLKSSSPSLDETFQKARDVLLIPLHLTPRERRIVYAEKNRHLFNNPEEPVVAHIGGVEVRLQPLELRQQLPRWGTLKLVAKLARTPDDWINVERLLEAYKKASIKLTPIQQVSVVRKAWFQGHQDAVLRWLERPEDTGIYIQTQQMLVQLLCGLRATATRAQWDHNSIKRALTGMRTITDLLEAPEHGGGDRAVKRSDLRSLPITIAAPLEMMGVRLVRYRIKEYEEHNQTLHEMRQATERLLNNISLYGTPIPDMDVDTIIKPTRVARYELLKTAEWRLLRVIPVRHAISLAQRILTPLDRMPQPETAQKALKDCDALIAENLSVVKQTVAPHDNAYARWAMRALRACDEASEGKEGRVVKEREAPVPQLVKESDVDEGSGEDALAERGTS